MESSSYIQVFVMVRIDLGAPYCSVIGYIQLEECEINVLMCK